MLYWLLQTSDVLRPVWSMDWDDVTSLVVAIAAFIAVFRVKRNKTESETHEIVETVDDSVLGRFQELLERIKQLEIDLAEAKLDLEQALVEIRELRKLEEYLQARLHEKDAEVARLRDERSDNRQEIIRLREELEEAEARIAHLELVCRRAGINGGDIEEPY